MMRTMVYLPDQLHRNLKHLAVERHTSLTELVREAVEALYREDLEDIRVGQERLQDHLRHPHQSISYATYKAKRPKRHTK